MWISTFVGTCVQRVAVGRCAGQRWVLGQKGQLCWGCSWPCLELMGEDLDLVDLAGVLQLDQNLLWILAEPAASRSGGEAGIDAAMTQ